MIGDRGRCGRAPVRLVLAFVAATLAAGQLAAETTPTAPRAPALALPLDLLLPPLLTLLGGGAIAWLLWTRRRRSRQRGLLLAATASPSHERFRRPVPILPAADFLDRLKQREAALESQLGAQRGERGKRGERGDRGDRGERGDRSERRVAPDRSPEL